MGLRRQRISVDKSTPFAVFYSRNSTKGDGGLSLIPVDAVRLYLTAMLIAFTPYRRLAVWVAERVAG